jgi:hypothetical protein
MNPPPPPPPPPISKRAFSPGYYELNW